MSNYEQVKIFDTTLRDGEQSPGCSMTLRQKLKVAHALAELKVDVIEAGFPAASQGDFEAVQSIASNVEGPVICGLARCVEGDIQACAVALEPADKKRIHVFIATSPIHREHKLKMSKEAIINQAVKGIAQAKKDFDDIEFSAEDAIRTEPEYLVEIFSAAIQAGATTLNVPDTVGYTTPTEMLTRLQYLKENIRGVENVTLSVHCHDDLGMGVANSLAAVCGGARQIECTINGIGERAGNCSLEEVVMAIKTRSDFFSVETNINTNKLYPTSRLVSDVTGSQVARNKAIVGDNAFAHEAGIHQHGMMQNRDTYEIMRPEDVGIHRSSLVLGKHSGRHAFKERADALGFDLNDKALQAGFDAFKKLADRKKDVFDSDIEAILLGVDHDKLGPWELKSMRVGSGLGIDSLPTATVSLINHQTGEQIREAAVGDGPVDATFKAMERALNIKTKLGDFNIRSISIGEDAQGQADVTAVFEGRFYKGRGLSTDIIEAAARAYLEVLNRIIRLGEARSEGQNAA
ncbi:MAG: 2-isopropylmalate synthase [bacterium]